MREKIMTTPKALVIPRTVQTALPQEQKHVLPEPAQRGLDMAEEEAEWVRRVRMGDFAAFDSLMTRYRPRALRLASNVLHNSEDAEDVVQEAFLRIYAQIREFRGEARFYTWFYNVVVRCCLNKMRIPYWKREQLFLAESLFADRAQPKQADSIEARLLVKQLMDRLSPPLRAALVLRELEGMDYLDIAELLEIPVGTVRSRLSVAREQFKSLYQSIQKETQDV